MKVNAFVKDIEKHFFNNLSFCIYQPKNVISFPLPFSAGGRIEEKFVHILQKHLKKSGKCTVFVTCDKPSFFFVFLKKRLDNNSLLCYNSQALAE